MAIANRQPDSKTVVKRRPLRQQYTSGAKSRRESPSRDPAALCESRIMALLPQLSILNAAVGEDMHMQVQPVCSLRTTSGKSRVIPFQKTLRIRTIRYRSI